MRLKFHNGDIRKCKNLIEAMLFKDGIPAAWLFSFEMTVIENTEKIEQMINPKNISRIEVYNDEEELIGEATNYDTVNSVIAKYNENGMVIEVQLKRRINHEQSD